MREESSRPLETTSSPNSLEEQEKEVALVLDFDNFNYHVLDKRASPVLIMSVRLDSLQSISLFSPQTTSRGKQAMILKNPADDLGIAIANIVGRRAKTLC